MEELKEKNMGKVADIKSINESKRSKSEKMTYEQLENVAHQLSEQVRQLYVKLQSNNLSNMFKRLDYLFKIIENGSRFDDDYVTKCVAEIKELMTVPENEEKENQDTATTE